MARQEDSVASDCGTMAISIGNVQINRTDATLSGALCGNKTFSSAAAAKPKPTNVLKNNNAGFLAILPKSIRFASLASIISLIVVMLSFVQSDAYGNRYFIAASVLFTIGLANLLHKCFSSKVTSCIAIVFIAASVVSQYFMIAQYCKIRIDVIKKSL